MVKLTMLLRSLLKLPTESLEAPQRQTHTPQSAKIYDFQAYKIRSDQARSRDRATGKVITTSRPSP